jgi:hypothetical protein
MTENKTNKRTPRCSTIIHGGMKSQMTMMADIPRT